MDADFDVICVGAGPAGEALTNELKGSGLSLAVIENNLVGGECAYWGCIPSKTQIRSAEVVAEAGRARALAVSRIDWQVDYAGRVAPRVKYMTRNLDDKPAAQSLEEAGARLFRGTGRLIDARTVQVDGTPLHASEAVVLATGTSPATPRITGIEGVPYWTNREAVQTEEVPESLLVVGTGAVGLEIGQAFARLGVKVQLIEGMDRILAGEDPEVSAFLRPVLEDEGIQITTSAKIARADQGGAGVKISLQSGETLEAERLLIAAGRHPNTDAFDLAAAGLRTSARGFIEVDPRTLRASPDGVYAAGDINGLGGFTHLSHYHGSLIARALKGEPVEADHRAVPRVTFTDPEVASVGLSEKQAHDRGLRTEVARAQVGETARGQIHGGPGGLIKLIADVNRRVLVGATLVSPRAGEMISELSLAIKYQVPVAALSDLIHPFPTFSRALQGVFRELERKLPSAVLLTE